MQNWVLNELARQVRVAQSFFPGITVQQQNFTIDVTFANIPPFRLTYTPDYPANPPTVAWNSNSASERISLPLLDSWCSAFQLVHIVRQLSRITECSRPAPFAITPQEIAAINQSTLPTPEDRHAAIENLPTVRAARVTRDDQMRQLQTHYADSSVDQVYHAFAVNRDGLMNLLQGRSDLQRKSSNAFDLVNQSRQAKIAELRASSAEKAETVKRTQARFAAGGVGLDEYVQTLMQQQTDACHDAILADSLAQGP
jgi:hypothetical protein